MTQHKLSAAAAFSAVNSDLSGLENETELFIFIFVTYF